MQANLDVASASSSRPGQIGERVVDAFLAHWDAAEGRATFAAFFRGAMTNERVARMLREFIQTELPRRLGARIPGLGSSCRVGLVATQLMGLAVARYVAWVDSVVKASRQQLVGSIGPTITRYLVGQKA